MNLSDYCIQAETSLDILSQKMRMPLAELTAIANGKRRPTVNEVSAIEIATGHEVTAVDFATEPEIGPGTVKSVFDALCHAYDTTEADLKGRRLYGDLNEARQVCVLLLREMLGMKYHEIADLLGRKHHSHILRAYREIHKHMVGRPTLVAKIERIKRLVMEFEKKRTFVVGANDA